MTREFTCIICPNGCEISADYEIQADQSVVIHSLEGATCKRGAEYVKHELTDPKRNTATSVLVEGGELPLASVRLTAPIPKARIFDAMDEIKKCRLKAPVKAGTVVIKGIVGLDADVIVTKNVAKA